MAAIEEAGNDCITPHTALPRILLSNYDAEKYSARSIDIMSVCGPPSLASFPPRCPLGALISTLGDPSLAGRKEGRKWVSFTHESVGHFEIRFWKTLGDGGSDGRESRHGAMHHRRII